MAAQFAGSRSLDERRRRRIAGTWDEKPASPPAIPADPNPESPPSSVGVYTPRNRRRLPLQRIIPAPLWKHLLLAAFLLAVGAGIFALERESERIADALGPSAGEFVSEKSGRLLPFFSGVLLAASAELALLIWWVRSHSRNDFSGRFHIWRWVSAAGFLLAASVVLDLHRLWSLTFIWRLHLDFAHCETLCWLAPAIGCGSVLVRDLMADIRNCRGSSTLLWLAVLSWGTSVFLLLGGGELFGDATRNDLAVSVAAAFGHYCLFVCLLLHARFVLFVSAEPPAQRPSPAVRMLKMAVTFAFLPLRAAGGLVRRKRAPAAETDGNAPPNPRTLSEQRTMPATQQREISASGTQAFVAEAFQDSRRIPSDDAGAAVPSAAGRTMRFDEPHELDDLAGKSAQKAAGARKHKRDKSRAS